MRSRSRLIGWGIVIVVLLSVVLLAPHIGRFLLGRGLAVAGRILHARVEYERIEGDPFSRPVIHGLLVAFDRDSLRVERLTLAFDLIGLLRRRFTLSNVELHRPTVYLGARQREPVQASESAKPGTGAFPRVSIGRLAIANGTVVLDSTVLADSISLDLGLVSGGTLVQAGLGNTTACLRHPKIRLRRLDARIRLTHDSLLVDSVNVMTSESRAQGNARLRFQTDELAVALDNLVLTLPEFSDLPGRILAKGSAGLAQGDLSADLAYAAQGLTVSKLALPSISGRVVLADSAVTLSATGASPELGSFMLNATLNLRDSSFAGQVTANELVIQRLEPALPDYRVGIRVECRGRGADSVAGRVSVRVAELGIDSLRCHIEFKHGRLTVDQADISGPLGR
ncbi:MAG: hypothetical protein ABIK86_07370, partial [candidate division WOR-3 bacterium]